MSAERDDTGDLFGRIPGDSTAGDQRSGARVEAVSNPGWQPLAERMRPRRLEEFIGQAHLLGEGRALRRQLESGRLPSIVLWGPPGTGKTTLARMMADLSDAQFISLSAVLSGVKDIRAAVDLAERARRESGQATVLFVDEVHRFNKAQQDAFLPHIENGTIVFVGATTENPAFELNRALLSRARVCPLRTLEVEDLCHLIDHALTDPRGLGEQSLQMSDELRHQLARAADGDGRRALNLLELVADLAQAGAEVDERLVGQVVAGGVRRFGKSGDDFYDQISVLHKAIRGSSPDAALYWLARMLDGGCDPRYLGRRLVRIASEDIGNADPRALAMALDAWEVQERLGAPEGELALAQAAVYLACAAKSNATYLAFQAAQADVEEFGSMEVPLRFRNAPTKLAASLEHGVGYRYAHDEPDAYAAGESYFPEAMGERRYYSPPDRGLESKIREKLARLRTANASAESAGE